MMDRLDRQIVDRLAAAARTPISQIAKELGIATATAHQRVKKLEERGVIQGYRAELDWEKIGLPVVAVVSLTLEPGSELQASADGLREVRNVQACYAVTGEFDLLAIVRARSSAHLGDVLQDIRRLIPGRTRTVVVLSTFFANASIPVSEQE